MSTTPDPQPGQVWRPTRDAERTRVRRIVHCDPPDTDGAILYWAVPEGEDATDLPKFPPLSCDFRRQWAYWVAQYSATPAPMSESAAGLNAARQAVINAARAWEAASRGLSREWDSVAAVPTGGHPTGDADAAMVRSLGGHDRAEVALRDALRALDAAEQGRGGGHGE